MSGEFGPWSKPHHGNYCDHYATTADGTRCERCGSTRELYSMGRRPNGAHKAESGSETGEWVTVSHKPTEAAQVQRIEVAHRATRYLLWVIRTEDKRFVLVEPEGNDRGRWAGYCEDEMYWPYLRDVLDLRDGDAEGWAFAFAQAGITMTPERASVL